MPCECSGFKVTQCSCKVVGTRSPWDGEFTNGVVLLANPNSFSNMRSSTKQPNPTTLMGLIDIFYEKCATFNLRYCPNRGFRKQDRFITCALKDLFILVCFMLANIVVLTVILSKTAVHLFFATKDTGHWIWRHLEAKLFRSDCMRKPMFTSYTHNFTPLIKRNDIYY